MGIKLAALLTLLASASGAPRAIPPQTVTNGAQWIIIAASDDSPQEMQNSAYVCSGATTGTTDDVLINNVIKKASPGSTIWFRRGTYRLYGPIVVDRSWITLRGENYPTWGGYNHAWDGATNVGKEGHGASELKMMVDSKNILEVQYNNIPDGGENRHRGLKFENLYFYGYGSAVWHNTGLYAPGTTGQDDMCCIWDCMFQNLSAGWNVNWDSPTIRSIVQDCAGTCTLAGTYGDIDGGLYYDDGGDLLTVINTTGATVRGVKFGDANGLNHSCIYLNNATGASISGCTFKDQMTCAIAVNGGGSHNISSDTFVFSQVTEPLRFGPNTTTSNNCVTGCTFKNNGSNASGYVANFGGATNCLFSNNVVIGGFNGGNSSVIYAGVGGNKVLDNQEPSNGLDPRQIMRGGGLVAMFDPTDKLTLWTTSSKSANVVNDGDLVGCWQDLSGNGNDWVQPTSANRPTWKANGLNGNPSVRFTGSPVYMAMADSATYKTPWLYGMLALKVTSNNTVIMGYPFAATHTSPFFDWNMYTSNAGATLTTRVGANTADIVLASNLSNPQVIEWGNEEGVGRQNNLTQATSVAQTKATFPTAVGMHLGSHVGGGEYNVGDYGRILVLSVTPNATQRELLNRWLRTGSGL